MRRVLTMLWAVPAATLLAAPGAAAQEDPPPARAKCLGAAARDPERPCPAQRLRLRVTPTPNQAQITPNLACTGTAVDETLEQCTFGLPAGEAVETVAVIGDSHAAHWRAALAVVAQAKRWRVLEIATPHCPLSAATPDSGPWVASFCPEWNRRVTAWLGEHPEVRIVFHSSHARAPIVVPAGRSGFGTRVEGYVRAWQALPASVQRLIVIRDNPTDTVGTHACVRRAIAARRPAGRACAIARKRVLAPDAGVAAAKRLRGRGARVVDLTPHFCGRRFCLPVVGGVLVHKDVDHLTQLFARTLGPYLLRGVDRLLRDAP